MNYYFHPEAEIEFNRTIDYYEDCRKDLGLEFATEIYKTIQRILNFPNAWQLIDDNIRRCIVNRFPFGIVYYVKNKQLIILAIMQLNRKPNYWLNRK